jgi:hypothetical protein
MEEQEKKPFIRRIFGFRSGKPWKMVVACIGYFFILMMIIGIATSGKSTPTSAPAAQPTASTSAPTSAPAQIAAPAVAPSAPAPAAPKPVGWQEVITFEGSSIKNTQTFHVDSDNWRISWSTWPGDYGNMNFQIMTYNGDGSMKEPGVAANVIGKGSDTSYMRGSGDYYLTINTGQPYKVVVEEQE